jgi:hypothetical protein
VWAAGVTVLWGLSASLFAGWFDTGNSYRTVFTSLKQHLPAKHRCVASRNLGDTQRAMVHYYANLITQREESSPGHNQCEWLLVQSTVDDPPMASRQWRLAWEGQRPRDKVERYRLYRRGAR